MSKVLSSAISSEKNKRFGASPINLLEIEFGGAVGTKYYSDRVVTVGSQIYEAVVKDWGDIDFMANGSATTSDLRITLVNTLDSPISDIFATAVPESKVARVYQWFGGLDTIDKELLFNGRITSPVRYSVDSVEIDIVDRILDLETKIGTVVTEANYPRSLLSHRGRILPIVYGTVIGVPAVCIFTAGKSELRAAMTDTSTTITVDDGSVFPAQGSGTWVLIIEDEQILIADRSGNTLTVDTRGYNGTTAGLHTVGTQIYEKQSTFRYQVFDDAGGVKAQSITDVRLNGVLLDTGDYIIDQVTYPGQIVFTSYPQLNKETESDNKTFDMDTSVNDESVPYASPQPPDAGSGPGTWTSDVAQMHFKVGQRVVVKRVATLDQTTQFKKAFIEVGYYGDREEWSGEIDVRAKWDGNNLGLLKDPIFEPELPTEPDTSAHSVLQSTGKAMVSPGGGFNQATDQIVQNWSVGVGAVTETTSQSFASSTSKESVTEEYNPTGLELLGQTFNPQSYGSRIPGDTEGRVPSYHWEATAHGMDVVFAGMGHRAVSLFPHTFESDISLYQYIDLRYTGFAFRNPKGTGRARVMSTNLRETHQLGPATAGVQRHYEKYIKHGSRSEVSFGRSAIYVDQISTVIGIVRVNSDITFTFEESGFGGDSPKIAQITGRVFDVHMVVTYEVETTVSVPQPINRPAPAPPPPSVIIPPRRNVRKSTPTTMRFEITDYITDWANILDTEFELRFESEGIINNSNVYVTSIKVITEGAKYNFNLNDEVTATVSGYYVDGTQIDTNYGSLNRTVSRPDYVFKHLLTWNSIFSLPDVDATYYSSAGNFFSSQLYRLDFALVDAITLRELLEKMSFQLRTDQYWEAGVHRIKVLEVETSASKAITQSQLKDLMIERSDIDELVNDLEIRYNVDYSFITDYTFNKFRSIITMESLGSKASYGTRKNVDDRFNFDLIRDDVTASHVGSYYLSFYSVIRRYVNMTCFLDQFELDKHDIVALSFPLDSLNNTPARILENKRILGDKDTMDQIQFRLLMEDYTYFKQAISDSMTMSEALTLDLFAVAQLADSIIMSEAINFGVGLSRFDNAAISESISFAKTYGLNIYDSFNDGFGTAAWGTSGFGGSIVSAQLSDVLTVVRIVASGTGVVSTTEQLFVTDNLAMVLYAEAIVTSTDPFDVFMKVSDSLTINLV